VAEQQFFLTREGHNKLKAEYEELTKKTRKEIIERIKIARAYGDLSENAEYSGAREQQSFVEGRIQELEHIINNAAIIKNEHHKDVIDIGSTVHLDVEGGTEKFTIVGSQESDPTKGFISNESPIGQALLGRKPGEEVEVSVPAGTIRYKIKKVE